MIPFISGSGREAEPLALVAAVTYVVAPLLVGEVPVDGFSEAGFEGLTRNPAQLSLDLAGIDGVALIVSGPIGDELNQIGEFADPRGVLCNATVEQVTQGPDYLDILHFIVTADIIGFANDALLHHQAQRARVIVDVKPV